MASSRSGKGLGYTQVLYCSATTSSSCGSRSSLMRIPPGETRLLCAGLSSGLGFALRFHAPTESADTLSRTASPPSAHREGVVWEFKQHLEKVQRKGVLPSQRND